MSKAVRFMLLALILSTIGSQDAFALKNPNKTILDSIPSLKLLYGAERDYRKSNDFKDIKNTHARKKIKHFCLTSLWTYTKEWRHEERARP